MNLIGGTTVLPRPLNEKERELLIWLIEHPSERAVEGLRGQVERATVCKVCSCGCPTIDFAIDDVPVSGKGSRLVSDYYATVDGMDVGVMLFETEGMLSCMEVYSCGGTDKPFGLPEVATMRSLEFRKAND